MTEESKPPRLSFERDFQAGRLPTVHVRSSGECIPIRKMEGGQLYTVWRWYLENDYLSPTYKALQREKERRRLGLPVVEPPVEIEPAYAKKRQSNESIQIQARNEAMKEIIKSRFEANVAKAEAELKCPECGSSMQIRNSRFGVFYGCSTYPQCEGSHGSHPDGRPLGKPADKETKRARVRAHAAFDALWKKNGLGCMTRKGAYCWMQRVLGLSKDAAHIANFDKAQCERLIASVDEYLNGKAEEGPT